MDYQELQSAVFDAYRRRDFPVCFSLLDAFSDTAQGEELGLALGLKAAIISVTDYRRVAEGFTLVDKALEQLQQNPSQTISTLVTALLLCYSAGDVERARGYETLCNQVLMKHGEVSTFQGLLFRLHLNLGLIATVRGEHASAYWHFVQGTVLVKTYGNLESANDRPFLFWLYWNTAQACIRMARMPEAAEALQHAEPLISTEQQRVHWVVGWSEVYRCSSRIDEAISMLERVGDRPSPDWDAESRVRFRLAKALAAQEAGDLRTYHEMVSEALRDAIENSLDMLLPEIQRIQRAPFKSARLGGK